MRHHDRGADPVVDSVGTSVYRFPTDAPEGDGPLAWDSTTVVVAQVRSGGTTGMPEDTATMTKGHRPDETPRYPPQDLGSYALLAEASAAPWSARAARSAGCARRAGTTTRCSPRSSEAADRTPSLRRNGSCPAACTRTAR
ncbi:hypothetical protein GCM10017744_100420 [Streptomyces antimycoticus]|uniref:Uncharacterized protein n=1 Tax=Streptomyces antimycoticus TaxID=68175 RepID=A0A4D4JZZ9_9ACTN|nr:hypothetical protein SANT12839_012820 [Streptomyces antimycoticus]